MQTLLELGADALKTSPEDIRIFTPHNTINLDKKTKQWVVEPHSYKYRNLSTTSAVYDPATAAPSVWLQFLEETMTSEHAKRTLACAIIYAACGARPWLRKAFYLHGPKRSGKSTILDAIQAVLGSPNCSALNMGQLGSTFGAASLVGKLANISNEMLSKKAIQDDVFKALISGEPIMVEQKFRDMYHYENTAKLFFGANGFPRILDESDAVWDRLTILNCPNSCPVDKADHNLKGKLEMERSGIFKWALGIFQEEYAKDECRSIMEMDTSGQTVMLAWKEVNNPALEWLKNRTTKDPDATSTVDQFYTDYRQWCRSSGHKESASNHFSRVISKAIHRTKGKTGNSLFHGIKLKPLNDNFLN
jgi:putative DNA primase/helicase